MPVKAVLPRGPKSQGKYPTANGVTTMPDGAEICDNSIAGREEYRKRTEQMAHRQEWKCAICGRLVLYPTFDHQGGRGGGGYKRDDRIEIDGRWHNAMLCADDNSKKGSKRYLWVEGEYVPLHP